MSAFLHSRRVGKVIAGRLCREDRASQIVEFALSVPLLVFFVVGIFDFSGALALKHKLANAAREAARVAASDPATDLNASVPASVSDAYQVADNYLLSEKVNDCGMAGTTPASAGSLKWASPALTGCTGGTGLVFKINRGLTTQITGTTEFAVNTSVTITYPYTWQFSGVAGLFGRFIGPTTITTTAVAFNEN